ncbi:MAG: DUF4369 domain-containing protein [Prevotella sp.]|nr:DUF4369 domain-containing protein [Prevotella sp.]
MNKFIGLYLLTLIVVACGPESGQFRIKGRLRNFNQGEFYVYSPDGGIAGMDTIKVADGRFSYQTPLEQEATFIIVFPNYTEMVVFGQKGKTAEISGDASHLKEVEVKGTKTNEQMTDFRLATSEKTPPQVKKAAENFISDNPGSIISIYLLDKYFLTGSEPDYPTAERLMQKMKDANKDNTDLALKTRQLNYLAKVKTGYTIPSFAATDINGKSVGNIDLKGELNIILAWAGWNYESTSIQRELRKQKKKLGEKLQIVGICIDADTAKCNRTVRMDSLQWKTICDQKLWESPVVKQLAITTVPGNIIADRNGKIVEINADLDRIKERIKKIDNK